MTRNFVNADKAVLNTKRRFGSAMAYIPVTVVIGGVEQGALFTRDQVYDAIRRGLLNPEDLPQVKRTWVQRVKRWWGQVGPPFDP